MSSSRRRFTPQRKAQIVGRHLAYKESVSDLAKECELQPGQIHLWVNLLLAQADKAFERSSGNTRANKAQAKRIQQLEAKLATKNEVSAELLEENVKSKKGYGELWTDVGFPFGFAIGTNASNLRATMPRLLDRMSLLSSHQRRPNEIPMSAQPARICDDVCF